MTSLLTLIALLLSGAASLVLETLWFEWLALHWGRTAEASAAVLACFMLGLGIGQWLMATRKTLPLSTVKLWALCEAAVGIFALLANWRFAQTSDVLGLSALPWMLLPTIAMGITLPLAVTVLRRQQLASSIGLAYAANTIGAALGTLVAAWWLTRNLGLSNTGHVAVIGQFAAALLVLSIKATPTTKSSTAAAACNTGETNSTENQRWPALFAVASSGLFILGMEILWFRALLLTHRSTSENFAVMLATVLIGLALGSALATASQRRWSSLPVKPTIAALLLAQCVLVAVPFSLWQPGSGGLLITGLWLITPVCACSGALMVFAAKTLNAQHARNSSAALILASTVGSTIGAPLIALLLLPSYGFAISLQLLLAVAVVAACINRPQLGALGAIIVLLLAWPLADRWQQKQTRAAALYVQLDNAQILRQTDGKYQSVQLLESSFLGEPLSHRLLTDSYSMTSTAADSERYMRLFAWLPQAMRSDLNDVLLISYGVGTTAETLLANANTQSLTIADPSSTILETSRLIPRNQQPLDDPRVKIRLEDGRKVLQQSPEQFDLVTGEPPPPRLAGMHALYSQEYFQLMHGALKPQGWASYWLPVDQLTVASSKAIINAFCAAFADCSLWAGSHYNWILLGSKRGQPQPNAINTFWENHSTTLKDTGLEDPVQLASTFIAGPHTLRQWAGDQTALTDNWPQRIESRWPADQDIQTYARWMDDADTEIRFSHSLYFQTWQPNAEKLQLAWATQALLNGQFRPTTEQRLNVLDQLLGLTQWETPILWTLGTDQQRLRIAQTKQSDVAALHKAVGLLAKHRFADARQQFNTIAALPHSPFTIAKDLAALASQHQSK